MILRFALGFLCAVFLGAAIVYAVIVSGCINPGADEAIPDAERWAAKTSLRAYLKTNVPKKNSPLPYTDENIADGARLYLNNCAYCHGFADGKMPSSPSGLYKRPPIFAKEDWSKDDDNLIYWFINHGVRLTGMPAYNKTLKDDQMWKIVMFIKRMNSLPPATEKYWQETAEHRY